MTLLSGVVGASAHYARQVSEMALEEALALIQDVPDYPKPGILFKDITPLLANGAAFSVVIEELGGMIQNLPKPVDAIVGIESRGFILGGALASALGIGFVTVRKPGKLPRDVHRKDYALEYGVDALELHKDLLKASNNVVIVDDVLATGGTALACHDLVELTNATIVAHLFLLEISFLAGRELIEKSHPGVEVLSLLRT